MTTRREWLRYRTDKTRVVTGTFVRHAGRPTSYGKPREGATVNERRVSVGQHVRQARTTQSIDRARPTSILQLPEEWKEATSRGRFIGHDR